MKLPLKCFARELREGDIVRVSEVVDAAYGHCTVKWIERDLYGASAADIAASPVKRIHLLRPYVAHTNFTYTGGVICYLGYEEFYVWPDTPVTLLQETDIPEVKRS